jgi:hypothetical protein
MSCSLKNNKKVPYENKKFNTLKKLFQLKFSQYSDYFFTPLAGRELLILKYDIICKNIKNAFEKNNREDI